MMMLDEETATLSSMPSPGGNKYQFQPHNHAREEGVFDDMDVDEDDDDHHQHEEHVDEAAAMITDDASGPSMVNLSKFPIEPNIKIALSLYKVQQSIYLLDFQRVEVRVELCLYGLVRGSMMLSSISFQGDAFGFMKLCAFIITELKNLSAASRAQQQQQMQQQTR